MKKQQFVAEIIGPAGAGKSTLSRALDGRDKTMRTGLSVWDMTPTLLAISFLLMLPTFFSFYWARRLLSWDEVKQLVRLKALNHLLDRERSKHYRTVLLNEGAVFTLAKLHAFGRGGENCWFEKCSDVDFNHWAKTLDAIIWLDAPDQVLAERIRARAKPHRMKDRTDREIYDFLARYRSSYERIVSTLKAKDGPKVIRICTDLESPDQIADRVLAGIQGEWRARRYLDQTYQQSII